mgnify:CR=1 FL=1
MSDQFENQNLSVAVLLPCYNEEVTIGKVVRDFKASLPDATIYVYDNNSTDRTAEIAEETGLSIPTVKSHTALAYQKLGVHNAMDAVLKARDLGLLD